MRSLVAACPDSPTRFGVDAYERGHGNSLRLFGRGAYRREVTSEQTPTQAQIEGVPVGRCDRQLDD